MPAEPSGGDDRGGAPNWLAYLVFTLISFAASMVGGCINPQAARQEAQQSREAMTGKFEELRQEVRESLRRNR